MADIQDLAKKLAAIATREDVIKLLLERDASIVERDYAIADLAAAQRDLAAAGLSSAYANTKEALEYTLACMGRSEAKQCADCHTTYSHSELWLFADYGFVCAACIEKRLKKKGAE
jgi:hypothetical protein